nr:3-phosphoglycerate kinase [Tanacetum cinerariifolium]
MMSGNQRAHDFAEGVTKFLKPYVAGLLFPKELDYLDGVVSNPKRTFASIPVGSKISSKIEVTESFLEKYDILLLGGGMIFTFYRAQGLSVASLLVEEAKLDLATKLLAKAKAKCVSLLVPIDVVIADKFAPDANTSVHSKANIDAPVVDKEKSFKQERIIAEIDEDVEINMEEAQAKLYKIDLEHPEKVLSMQDVDEEEPAKVEEVLKVVKAAKLMIEVVTTTGATITAEAPK